MLGIRVRQGATAKGKRTAHECCALSGELRREVAFSATSTAVVGCRRPALGCHLETKLKAQSSELTS